MSDEKATAEKLPTAAEFEKALAFITQNEPDKWAPIVNSIVIAALRKAEDLETNLKRLVYALLKQGVIKAQVSTPEEAAPADAGVAAPGVPPGSGQPRKAADGSDLTPQEAAIEEMMDTAPVDNSQPAPVIAGQGPAQKRRFAKGAKAAAAANGGGQRVGGDGKPLTPQEAAIEDMMDEAPVVND
jgi:hypothetical protein